MNLRRLRAVARKELLHVVRDSRSLALSILIPVLLMFLFGYALTLDVDDVPLAVWDQSRSHASREFVSRFDGSRYFSVKAYADAYGALERAIDSREALAAMVIPYDFAKGTTSGRRVAVQFIVDGSDPNTATIALGYAEAVVKRFAQEVSLESALRAGRGRLVQPLDLRLRVWFNPELESRNYIIPGLIAIIMMVIAALLTSLSVAGEWERGTMEQLISTPVTPREVVLGKLLVYFAIGMLDVALSVAVGHFLFHVPLRGSVALVFALAAVFLVGALSMGMALSAALKSQLLASQAAMVLTFIPSFLLSGLVFPIANMPRPVQLLTYLVPARYFVSLLKDIYMKGLGMSSFWLEAALLGCFSAAMLTVAMAAFRKKMV